MTEPTVTEEVIASVISWAAIVGVNNVRAPTAELSRVILALSAEREALRVERDNLITVLEWFLEDERFQVTVGGNPTAVEGMLALAYAALKLARREP